MRFRSAYNDDVYAEKDVSEKKNVASNDVTFFEGTISPFCLERVKPLVRLIIHLRGISDSAAIDRYRNVIACLEGGWEGRGRF